MQCILILYFTYILNTGLLPVVFSCFFYLNLKNRLPKKTPSASLPSLLAFTTEACVWFHRECPSAPQWGKRGKTFWSGLTAGGGRAGGALGRDTHSAGLLAPNWVKNGRGRRLIFMGENRETLRRGRKIKGLKLPVIAPQRRA